MQTDLGTVLLHWLLVGFLVVLVGTGLRMAADDPALRWITVFDAVLPRENLWYWHLVGALGFSATFMAYITYVLTARLGARTRLDVQRLAMLWRGGPARWSTFNAVLMWFVFGAFTAEIVSGCLLFLGQGGWALLVHRNSVWICLAFPLLHVLGHLLYGGHRQVLRILRPTKLIVPPPPPDILALLAEHVQLVEDLQQGRQSVADPDDPASKSGWLKASPLPTALVVGVCVAAAGLALQWQTRMTLVVPSIEQLGLLEAPVVDGDTSDPIWTVAQALTILTDHGANFDPTGQSRVEIKAVRDRSSIYLAIMWTDPTRSLKHLPLIKRDDGWQVATTRSEPASEEVYNEDQFSILLSRPTVPVVGAGIHLARRPLPDYPPSATGRGLHYTAPGTLADIWLWRADHGGLIGVLEDGSFGPPVAPSALQVAGLQQYRGGYRTDPGIQCFGDNFQASGTERRVVPTRLPTDLGAMSALMGDINGSPNVSEPETARWWLTLSETLPYAAELDAAIPAGTVIPGVLMSCLPSGDQADVKGIARWAADRWTLELRRQLDTHSDRDLPIQAGLMLWLAAFDHAATRHTRQVRPIYLDIR